MFFIFLFILHWDDMGIRSIEQRLCCQEFIEQSQPLLCYSKMVKLAATYSQFHLGPAAFCVAVLELWHLCLCLHLLLMDDDVSD